MQAGTRLGRYTIVSPLGAGGMGEVYRARDERLGREVAVKVLPDELSRDEAALGRFRREARVLAGLSHPNLLAIFDVGEQDGVAYAVLELLEGETLRERLRRGPLGEEATRIGAGIARGLAAAHARGVVHRDLKPENVFLDAEGRVKVLDFGLAKEVVGDDPADLQESTELLLTQANTVLGTPGYMAPEQVRGEAATPRTDVFALGCILHEMISGRSPFRRPTLVSTLSAVLHEEPPEIDSSPGLPSRLVRLIRRCLAKAPEDRPASAAEVADELHGVVGPRRGTARRLGRWRPSRRALAAAAAVILLSALALLATRWWPAPGDGRQGAAPSGAAAVASLAVLPLTDRTAPEGAEEAYFAEGIAEAWIQRLSRLPDLKVISRASTLRYRGAARDPLAAGEALGVEALLLGEIVPLGEEVRLGAELVAAGDGARLWGAAVTGSPADLLTLQETLVDGLVASLGREVPDAALPEAARAHDPQAHRLYLQGRHHWSKRDAESLRQAIALFDEAIAADPQFALAYAGLADVYSILHDFADIPAAETFPRAAAAARRAIQLAPDLAEAHNSLAYVDHYWQRDFAAAEAGYRRALELNPSYATAWQWYAELLTSLGRFDEAEAAGKKAAELDPLSPMIHAILGWNYEMAGRFQQAIEQNEATRRVFPGFGPARVYLARAYVQAGRAADGVALLEEDRVAAGERPIHTAWLAWAYARDGRRAEAERLVSSLRERQRQGEYVLPYYLAYPYVAVGREEAALDLLAEALEQRVEQLLWLAVDPALDPLRDSRRFAEILRRAGFRGLVAISGE